MIPRNLLQIIRRSKPWLWIAGTGEEVVVPPVGRTVYVDASPRTTFIDASARVQYIAE